MKTTLIMIALTLSMHSFANEKISPEQAYSALKAGTALLFDVREQEELKAEGKADGAVFFPKSSVDKKDKFYKEMLAKIPKDKTLIFYCRSGKRAGMVANVFSTMGYTSRNMGSLQDWANAGLPVVPGLLDVPAAHSSHEREFDVVSAGFIKAL